MIAVLYALLAAFSLGGYTIVVERGLRYSSPLSGILIMLIVETSVLMSLAGFTGGFFFQMESSIVFALVAFVLAGVLAPGLGNLLSYVSIERLGVVVSSPISASSPIFAIRYYLSVARCFLLRFFGCSEKDRSRLLHFPYLGGSYRFSHIPHRIWDSQYLYKDETKRKPQRLHHLCLCWHSSRDSYAIFVLCYELGRGDSGEANHQRLAAFHPSAGASAFQKC